jgi:hypothetical protein
MYATDADRLSAVGGAMRIMASRKLPRGKTIDLYIFV